MNQKRVLDLSAAKTVMVFGAHGDDEILGCGGVIWMLGQLGAKIIVVTATMRETAHAGSGSSAEACSNAEREMTKADDILGIHYREKLGIPNRQVKHDGETFATCAKLIRQWRPDIVFCHSMLDQHIDHRGFHGALCEARYKAHENIHTNPPDHPDVPGWGPTHDVPLFLIFGIMLTQFSLKPHVIVEISEEALDKKIEAMKSQASQLEILGPVVQGIEGAALYAGSMIGAKYGEWFTFGDSQPYPVRLPQK